MMLEMSYFSRGCHLAVKYEAQNNKTPRVPFSRRLSREVINDKLSSYPATSLNPPNSSHKGQLDSNATARNLSKQPMVEQRANPCAKIGILMCFKGNQAGHRSSECPLRKTIHIVEEMEGDDSEEEDAVDFDEIENVMGDESEKFACIVQKILLTLKETRPTQRHTIFIKVALLTRRL